MSAVRNISPRELQSMDMKQVLLVDVRTPMEYSEKRLTTATALAPVNGLDVKDVALRNGILPDTPVFTLCASGRRATVAAAKFVEAGFADVRVVEGGLIACQQTGFATMGQASPKTGEASPTLDRQVRLVAGTLSMIFLLLGYFVHGAFYLGALFVAAGQIFSGLTNWCGMAMLLMRAPWNQKTSCAIGGPAPRAGVGSSPGASCQ